MTFEQVDLFLAACDSGSISAAARLSFVSHQAASQALRRLEGELGCELLERGPAGVVPTEKGRELYAPFRAIREARMTAERLCRTGAAAPVECLNVGLAYGVMSSLGPAAFESFSALHPQVALKLHDDSDRDVEERVAAGVYDVGLAVEPVDRRQFDVIPLWREEVYLQAYTGSPLFGRREASAAELAGQLYVNAGPRQKSYENFPNYCRELGFEPRILETGGCCEYAALAAIAVKNSALFAAPAHMVDDAQTHVCSIRPPAPLYWSISFVSPRGGRLTPGAAALARYLLVVAARRDATVCG